MNSRVQIISGICPKNPEILSNDKTPGRILSLLSRSLSPAFFFRAACVRFRRHPWRRVFAIAWCFFRDVNQQICSSRCCKLPKCLRNLANRLRLPARCTQTKHLLIEKNYRKRPWKFKIRQIPGRLVCGVGMVLFFGMGGVLKADEAAMTQYRGMLERNGFNENREMRRKYFNVLKSPVFPEKEPPFSEYKQAADGRIVQFELKKTMDAWYIIFRNQKGEMPRATWPNWGKGTWIIKKDIRTGLFLQAKIFLYDGEDSFIRVFPENDRRSKLDIFLFDKNIGKGIILPVSFEELLVSPFARILYLSAKVIDWNIVFPNPDRHGYRMVEYFVNNLKPYSSRIVEFSDSAINSGGDNVFIETGRRLLEKDIPPGLTGFNCAGYVKWVADGIYSAWKDSPGGLYLDIKDMRRPTSKDNRNAWNNSRAAANPDARNALESLLRDPNFGLDWNRNLAWAIESARLSKNLSPEEQSRLETWKVSGLTFRKDNGFRLEDIPYALHQLAAQKPGTVYLAAVNSRFVPEPGPGDPNPLPLLQYWHVAVLAPWFEAGDKGRGTFHTAVLDTGDAAETLLKKPGISAEPGFVAKIRENAIRYARLGSDKDGKPHVPEIMVHLTQVKLPVNFQPMPLP